MNNDKTQGSDRMKEFTHLFSFLLALITIASMVVISFPIMFAILSELKRIWTVLLTLAIEIAIVSLLVTSGVFLVRHV